MFAIAEPGHPILGHGIVPSLAVDITNLTTLTTIETTKVVEADNPFQAAVLVGGNVTDVRPARGRVAGATTVTKPARKVAKKRKPLSPEARAKLAQNLVKARAARARNAKAAKNPTRASAVKKATKKR